MAGRTDKQENRPYRQDQQDQQDRPYRQDQQDRPYRQDRQDRNGHWGQQSRPRTNTTGPQKTTERETPTTNQPATTETSETTHPKQPPRPRITYRAHHLPTPTDPPTPPPTRRPPRMNHPALSRRTLLTGAAATVIGFNTTTRTWATTNTPTPPGCITPLPPIQGTLTTDTTTRTAHAQDFGRLTTT
ncbi:hypothetical protein AB0O11_21315, partial [Kitasatospora sp. NPDC093102]